MLTPADPAAYADAINRPHRALFRIDVLDGTGNKLDEIPHLDGSVQATLGSQTTRTAELLIDPALSPKTATDLLYPAGNRLAIYRGLDYGCGNPELLPVFHGRINAIYDSPRAPMRLRAVDLAADIRDAGFTVPTNSIPGAAIQSEFERLVKGALPSAQFGPSDTFSTPIGQQTWDTDRAQALDDMANAVGAFWYTLSDGRFVIRRVPWTIPRTPELSLVDNLAIGCEPLPIIADPYAGLPQLLVTDSTRERSREWVHNIVTVAAERTDGSPPIVYTALDTDPASPTWVGGNYGLKSRHVRTDVALTPAQVQLMAQSSLRRSIALLDNWSVQTIPDARVELGDCVRVACQRVVSIQVVAALRISLKVDGVMEIGTRALRPEFATVVSA